MVRDLQKANIWKRVSAWLFDFTMLATLAIGILYIGCAIFNTDQYIEQYQERVSEIREEVCSEQGFVEITDQSVIDAMSEEERAEYDKRLEEIDKLVGEREDKDERGVGILSMQLSVFITIAVFAILISYIIWEFIMPLIFKNGQTLGKKIFGVAVMRVDGVKISPVILFIRAILGKYTLETMVPLFCLMLPMFGQGYVGPVVVVLIAALEIVCMCVTKTNSAVHDAISSTVTVDMASQKIFETTTERDEYLKRLHDESEDNGY